MCGKLEASTHRTRRRDAARQQLKSKESSHLGGVPISLGIGGGEIRAFGVCSSHLRLGSFFLHGLGPEGASLHACCHLTAFIVIRPRAPGRKRGKFLVEAKKVFTTESTEGTAWRRRRFMGRRRGRRKSSLLERTTTLSWTATTIRIRVPGDSIVGLSLRAVGVGCMARWRKACALHRGLKMLAQ